MASNSTQQYHINIDSIHAEMMRSSVSSERLSYSFLTLMALEVTVIITLLLTFMKKKKPLE